MMRLEYLFVDKQNREAAEAFTPKDGRVSKALFDIENADCWMAVFESDDADALSGVHEEVMSQFHPVVLTNECSAYYNQVLFPLFNDFERKLRKLLYVKNALNGTKNGDQNIGYLEEQDLGSIFDMLFTDTEFVNAAKQKVNEKSWKYTKDELLGLIRDIPENVLWDSLIGPDCVPTLRRRFLEVRFFRNDTMHAHNMDAAAFKNALALVNTINRELDAEIEDVIGRTREQTQTETDRHFNTGMAAALNTLVERCKADEYDRARHDLNDGLSAIGSLFPALFKGDGKG